MQLHVGGVPEHFNLPWHLAAESGRLALTGVDVVWHDQPGGTGQMTTALADGELDLIVALTEGVVAAIAGGLDARILRLYTSTPLQWGVHVAGGSDLDPSRLAGARFAISRVGSGSHLMAHVLADRLALELDDGSFVAVGDLDGARDALAAGDAEVFLWDRFMTSPLVASGEFRRIDVQPTPWPAFVVAVADRVSLSAKPVPVAAVLDAVAEAATAFERLEEAAPMISERYGLAPHEADAWIDATRFAPPVDIDPQIVVDVEQRLAALGIIEAPLGPAHYLTPPTGRARR